MERKQAVLVGPPNCGKSSLFRLLTGRRVKTGNRAGVTVEALTARIPGTGWDLTDLPGLRSRCAASEDERVTVSFLSENPPDLVLAVCDATQLAGQGPLLHGFHRELFPGVPVVLVLNVCDELTRFPAPAVFSGFPVPVFPISARSGEGIGALRTLFLPGAALPDACVPSGAWVDRLCRMVGPVSPARLRRVAAWDRLLLSPMVGALLFVALTVGILWLVFGPPGSLLTDRFASLCLSPLAAWLGRLPVGAWLRSLLCEGILGGVGAVLGFFPQLLLLFLFQTFLEQSGYLARASRLFDPLLSRFGLRGDAITPLLLGFGCSVPAILCTRGMKDACARRRCARYLPAVACSARIPLCLTVSNAFFPGKGWWICALLWAASGVVFLLFCAVDAKLDRHAAPPVCHRDALPLLRLPSLSELLGAVCEQLVHFFSRAGGLILLSSVGVWLLSHFCPGQAGMVPAEQSALAVLGGWIAPVFLPQGLNDWRIVSALLCGACAKEAALSTLGVLLGASGGDVGAALLSSGILDARSACALLVFYLFYFPCAATWSVQKHPRRWWGPLLFAYLASALAYRI